MASFKDAADAIHTLPLTAAQEMEKAVRAAGQLGKARIVAATPRGATGRTARAVTVRTTGRGLQTRTKVHAGGFAQILISGAKPHSLRPGKKTVKKAVAWPGGPHPFATAMHPGLPPDPYVARAIEAALPEINQLFEDAGIRVVAGVTQRVRS